jgi:type II secretory pathway component PulC
MRIIKATAIVAMLAMVPAVSFAQAAKKSAAAPAKKSATVASHSTAGVVKSSTDSSLVITKGGKDETFTLNSSTEKTGTIANGSHVTVHYTMDGKNMVATAVSVQPAKASKPKGKK